MKKRFAIFDMVNIIILGLFSLSTLLPFIHVFVSSITSADQVSRGGFIFLPEQFSLHVYEYIFHSASMIRSIITSIMVTVLGTLTSMLLTICLAYPLSRKYFKMRSPIMTFIIITMFIHGGLIPTFLVVKGLGLLNSILALILPPAINTFNLIIIRSFFDRLPPDLEEAARIDGAGDLRILFQIMLPISTPMLATFTLFYVVQYWNAYMAALFYISNPKLWPLQLILRNIIMMAQASFDDASAMQYAIDPEQLKMTVIVIAIVPMLLIYPLLQKYFTKGIMLGALKG